jgi:hypothetical protein
LKSVKTRNVVQMVVEVPIERAEAIVSMFGYPGQNEIPVAVALMNTPPNLSAGHAGDRGKQSTPARGLDGVDASPQGVQSRTFSDMPRAQQAGILCDDYEFADFADERALNRQKVFNEPIPQDAVDAVRTWCGVKSRSELNEGRAAPVWDALVLEFRQWQTERRYS